jgi:DNA-binding NarL/FixJ family response regulator
MIKILVADDQQLFRSMLVDMLTKDPDIEVVAFADNGQEAIQLALKHHPDVLLLDIQMPIMSGVDALTDLKSQLPDAKFIMLTTFENPQNISTACSLGADGYLVKDMKPQALILAVKCVYYDMVLFHRSAYNTMLETKNIHFKDSLECMKINDQLFNGTDLQIIRLIVEGKTNREIAQILNYSQGTIKNRVSKILSMTGLSDRSRLSVFAVTHQIV